MQKNRSITVARVQGRLTRDAQGLLKKARQCARPRSLHPSALFIVGMQRSGTNMLDGVLNNSLDCTVFNEDHPRAFENYRLRSIPEIQSIIQSSHSQWAVFKPLCDTQRLDELLAAFDGSKTVWIYRNYYDVIRSVLKKWPEEQRTHVRRVVEGDTTHWISERVPDEHRELLAKFYTADLPVHDAAALVWLLRHTYYFDFRLDTLPDKVLLINYDRLVTEPEAECRRVFDFLGIEFDPSFVSFVHSTSKRNTPIEEINPGIVRLCDSMWERLENEFARQRQA